MTLILPARPQAFRVDVPQVADPVFAADAGGGVISIFAPIGADFSGEGVTDARIAAALRQIGPRPVRVQINSPGGDVWIAASIFNLLRGHGHPITVEIVGIAASAASLIAMAGDRILAARNAMFMIHNAHGAAMGDARVMEAVRDVLTRADAALAETYSRRSGLPVAQVAALMDRETFMSADEAISLGFADALLDRDAEATPRALSELRPRSKVDLSRHLHAAGFSRTASDRIAAGGWGALAGEPDIDTGAVAAAFTENAARLRAALQGA